MKMYLFQRFREREDLDVEDSVGRDTHNSPYDCRLALRLRLTVVRQNDSREAKRLLLGEPTNCTVSGDSP
jgi:hypothetical protein